MQDRLSEGIEMPKIAVIYATGLGRTKKMAEAIASGAMTIEGTPPCHIPQSTYRKAPSDSPPTMMHR